MTLLIFLRRLILFTFLILLGGIALLFLFRVPVAEFLLSRSIDSNVKIGSMSIEWNKVVLNNFKIQNPKEASTSYSFEASKITVKTPFLSLFNEPLTLSRLKIEDPTIRIELQLGAKNLHNWESLKPTKEETEKPSKPHPMIIENLSLINTNIEIVRTQKAKIVALPTIPYLELNRVMINDDHAGKQLLRLILQLAIEQIKDKNNLGTFLNSLFSTMELPEPSLLDTMNGKMKEGIEHARKKAGQAQEYLKNLFSK